MAVALPYGHEPDRFHQGHLIRDVQHSGAVPIGSFGATSACHTPAFQRDVRWGYGDAPVIPFSCPSLASPVIGLPLQPRPALAGCAIGNYGRVTVTRVAGCGIIGARRTNSAHLHRPRRANTAAMQEETGRCAQSGTSPLRTGSKRELRRLLRPSARRKAEFRGPTEASGQTQGERTPPNRTSTR